MQRIGSTYKALEVEETLDIYFYRPLGYLIARSFHAFRLTPNVATILSIVVGLIGGHFFYYRDFTINVIGVALFILGDVLDSADGQLARISNIRSLYGRILDGVGGNLIFINAYVHLCLRIIVDGANPLVWVLVVVAGACHSVQSGLADYFRNAYVKYVVDTDKAEIHHSAFLHDQYKYLSWKKDFLKKLGMRLYLNYTSEQETFARGFQTLRRKIQDAFGETIPSSFSEEYRRLNKPLLKYYSMLAVNLRVIVMCLTLLVNRPVYYFWFELIFLNAVMFALIRAQEDRNKKLIRWVESHTEKPVEVM